MQARGQPVLAQQPGHLTLNPRLHTQSVVPGACSASLTHPLPSSDFPGWWRGGRGQHLLLQLAELGREAVNADAGLLQLLVRGPHQVAVPLS